MTRILNITVTAIWMIHVLSWPVLQWVFSLDVVFQMMKMFYHWNMPEMNAGWIFIGHFAAFTVATFLARNYKPKGFEF